ncbi:MAG TPA: zf-TFIIB domain-containing protein [Pyrinomonadaceae bacterium]
MKAETLNCPNCGAAVSSESPRCQFCESKLATVACPSCFAMMFIGSRHCPHCGAAAAETRAAPLSTLKCPKCKSDMQPITLGGSAMRECERCGGLWLEVAAFEKICADREHQAAVLGLASPVTRHQLDAGSGEIKVRYFPCPQCGQLMNRMNFARCSGVIVDVCRGHGIWFDASELRAVIEFIRGGGLGLSREKEKREIAFEREQLQREQFVASRTEARAFSYSDEDQLSGFSAARGLLKFIIEV